MERYAIFQHVRIGMREFYSERIEKEKAASFRRVSVWFYRAQDADSTIKRLEYASEAGAWFQECAEALDYCIQHDGRGLKEAARCTVDAERRHLDALAALEEENPHA